MSLLPGLGLYVCFHYNRVAQVAEELGQTCTEHDEMLAERQEHEERLRKVGAQASIVSDSACRMMDTDCGLNGTYTCSSADMTML